MLIRKHVLIKWPKQKIRSKQNPTYLPPAIIVIILATRPTMSSHRKHHQNSKAATNEVIKVSLPTITPITMEYVYAQWTSAKLEKKKQENKPAVVTQEWPSLNAHRRMDRQSYAANGAVNKFITRHIIETFCRRWTQWMGTISRKLCVVLWICIPKETLCYWILWIFA